MTWKLLNRMQIVKIYATCDMRRFKKDAKRKNTKKNSYRRLYDICIWYCITWHVISWYDMIWYEEKCWFHQESIENCLNETFDFCVLNVIVNIFERKIINVSTYNRELSIMWCFVQQSDDDDDKIMMMTKVVIFDNFNFKIKRYCILQTFILLIKNTFYVANSIFEIIQQRNVILTQSTRHLNFLFFAHQSMRDWIWREKLHDRNWIKRLKTSMSRVFCFLWTFENVSNVWKTRKNRRQRWFRSDSRSIWFISKIHSFHQSMKSLLKSSISWSINTTEVRAKWKRITSLFVTTLQN